MFPRRCVPAQQNLFVLAKPRNNSCPKFVSWAPDNAATISQPLQTGILLRQFDAKNSDPDLATLLAFVRVIPNGEGLEVSFAVTSDQLVSLIKRNTFSAKR
jgi:hypothetical protein